PYLIVDLKLCNRTINNYYEPFLGGGAVYFNINAKHYYVNDKSKELMDFYKNIASQNESISYCYRN
ncbi:TPA: DNA adenine methylase, partial [Enterococcus faecalis]|nr:DNA adenine methylase [Enterococcus faecalis]